MPFSDGPLRALGRFFNFKPSQHFKHRVSLVVLLLKIVLKGTIIFATVFILVRNSNVKQKLDQFYNSIEEETYHSNSGFERNDQHWNNIQKFIDWQIVLLITSGLALVTNVGALGFGCIRQQWTLTIGAMCYWASFIGDVLILGALLYAVLYINISEINTSIVYDLYDGVGKTKVGGYKPLTILQKTASCCGVLSPNGALYPNLEWVKYNCSRLSTCFHRNGTFNQDCSCTTKHTIEMFDNIWLISFASVYACIIIFSFYTLYKAYKNTPSARDNTALKSLLTASRNTMKNVYVVMRTGYRTQADDNSEDEAGAHNISLESFVSAVDYPRANHVPQIMVEDAT